MKIYQGCDFSLGTFVYKASQIIWLWAVINRNCNTFALIFILVWIIRKDTVATVPLVLFPLFVSPKFITKINHNNIFLLTQPWQTHKSWQFYQIIQKLIYL